MYSNSYGDMIQDHRPTCGKSLSADEISSDICSCRDCPCGHGRKPKPNILPALIMISALAVAFVCTIISTWQGDLLWTIPTGEEILSGGILRTSPFIIDDVGIVVQQWLFDVFAALFAKLGHIGCYIFACVNSAALIASVWFFLSQYRLSRLFKALSSAAVCCFITLFTGSSRANSLTLALLLVTCYALERFRSGSKRWILILLPATVFLEANLHSSMVLFHFAVILTYVLPTFSKKLCAGNGLKGRLRPVALATAVSAVAAFINPYGTRGVMYLPLSVFSGTFHYVDIYEMRPLFASTFPVGGLVVIAGACTLAIFLMIRRRVTAAQLYMVAGVTVLSFLSIRNLIFMTVPVISMLPVLYGLYVEKNNNNKEKGNGRITRMLILFLALAILALWLGVTRLPQEYIILRGTDAESAAMVSGRKDLENIDAYIKQNGEDVQSVKIYTGFNDGGYFEYLGYRNVFIDARPELYMKSLNGSKDILPEFSVLYYGDDEAVQAFAPGFLAEYDFDYIVVPECGFRRYLDSVPNEYETCLESGMYRLYRPIDESGKETVP